MSNIQNIMCDDYTFIIQYFMKESANYEYVIDNGDFTFTLDVHRDLDISCEILIYLLLDKIKKQDSKG